MVTSEGLLHAHMDASTWEVYIGDVHTCIYRVQYVELPMCLHLASSDQVTAKVRIPKLNLRLIQVVAGQHLCQVVFFVLEL